MKRWTDSDVEEIAIVHCFMGAGQSACVMSVGEIGPFPML